MRTTLTLAVSLLAAWLVVPAASAQDTAIDRLILQEQAHGLQSTPPSLGQRIIAQERGRHADARVFGSLPPAPVQVAAAPDGFDYADAGIGGATVLALGLLAGAAVAVVTASRRRTA